MSLIDLMMDSCVIMNRSKVSDGEGGFITEWTEGADVLCAIVNDTSMSARVAEKDGVTSTYTITTRKNVVLEYHDVIKRKKDGKIFRITSDINDKISPSASSLDMAQVSAERWELTK